MTDPTRPRRHSLRWYILLSLNTARPAERYEAALLGTLRAIDPDTRPEELHQALDDLTERRLVRLERQASGLRLYGLSRHGVGIAEYCLPCPADIARPERYWNGA